jgi:hypothetical protein
MTATSDTSADELVSDTTDGLFPNLAELKAAHADLMCKYVAVLGEASTWGQDALPGIEDDKPRPSTRKGSRWIVDRLVQAHIRKRVRLLASAYSQLGQLPDIDDDSRDWLAKMHDRCTSLSNSLVSWRVPGVLALIPPAITIATLLAKTHINSHSIIASVTGVLLGSLLWAILGWFTVRNSYRAKRTLFLWGYTRDRPSEDFKPTIWGFFRYWPVDESVEPIRNIYLSENRLFSLLDRHKPREWSAVGVFHVLSVGILILSIVVGHYVPKNGAWGWGFLAAIGVWIILFLSVSGRLLSRSHSKWR